jgi:hypothetical protein
MPNYSPADAARQAIADYDKNKDGVLDAQELEFSPPLKSALKYLDKNRDGKLSTDEIADRLERFRGSGTAMLTVACLVTMNEEPLTEATVTLVPEKFMGPALKPASAVTDKTGRAIVQVQGAALPGVPLGFYRIEVSKKQGDRETIPAQYNSRTTLGVEIGLDFRAPLRVQLRGG